MLDQKSRKLNIIEEVLHLQSDEQLAQLEELLVSLRITTADEEIPAMPAQSQADIKADFEQALREISSGDSYSHEEIVAMAQQWRAA
jgi:hypothetical protein